MGMKWVSKDMDMYLGAKEYVDTVVLPLLPISFGDDLKQTASMTEFISLLTIPLERQFKGRLMMLPGYTYLKSDSDDSRLQVIKHWETEFKKSGFKHMIYITSDSGWRTIEDKCEGTVIWLPSLPLENMDEKYRNSILEDQIGQLIHLFVKKWQNND